jgi:hypothetical protein
MTTREFLKQQIDQFNDEEIQYLAQFIEFRDGWANSASRCRFTTGSKRVMSCLGAPQDNFSLMQLTEQG